MQLCVIGMHSTGSEALFVVLLALVMGSLIFINFVSAIQVTRTQDFTGKTIGKAICIVFHSFQLGIVWRSLKLLILYDHKDWLDYLNMRLFHSGFQSLPFSMVLTYSMFVNASTTSLDIATVVVSLLSSAISLTMHRTGNILFQSDDIEDRKYSVRKHIGVILLMLSTCSILVSRCSSLVLFTVVKPFWIAVPISLHFIVHIIIEVSRLKCADANILSKVANSIYISFVNIYDMIGRDYTGVKCSYVLFYSVMLVENIVFSFYWMLTSVFDERFKLIAVLVILLCFIIGLFVKCTSCGCIFNIESDILSDAFSNPELQGEKVMEEASVENILPERDKITRGSQTIESSQLQSVAVVYGTVDSPVSNYKRSKHGSSNTSSDSRLIEYDNQAFIKSQGNISLNSKTARSINTRSHNSDNKRESDVSYECRTLSLSSEERAHRSPHQTHNSQDLPTGKANRTRGKIRTSRSKHKHSAEGIGIDSYDSKPPLKQRIIVSDTSKHAAVKQSPAPRHIAKINSAEIASANNRYSRNTHTLNGSVKHYHYNGFDDPFREKKLINKKNAKMNSRLHDYYHQHQHQHHDQHHMHHKYSPDMDYSLDSSELYPSMTSDTSSMSSYTETNRRIWRKSRQRMMKQSKHFDTRDGYSTDISNSDYLSFNDYSMGGSSSWTESSSSSDGAATWPPAHAAHLLKMYNIPDKKSSTDNIMHWLDTMTTDESVQDTSFSTLRDPSIASDTDISLSAMHTFEVKTVKKEKKKFKRLISKPKGLLFKFSSLNYKGKEKSFHNRPYPLKRGNAIDDKLPNRNEGIVYKQATSYRQNNEMISLPTMPLPIDSVQESIV